jgi:hypothetical protein
VAYELRNRHKARAHPSRQIHYSSRTILKKRKYCPDWMDAGDRAPHAVTDRSKSNPSVDDRHEDNQNTVASGYVAMLGLDGREAATCEWVILPVDGSTPICRWGIRLVD